MGRKSTFTTLEEKMAYDREYAKIYYKKKTNANTTQKAIEHIATNEANILLLIEKIGHEKMFQMLNQQMKD